MLKGRMAKTSDPRIIVFSIVEAVLDKKVPLDEALETAFVEQAESVGMVGLKGHRSVGGLRVSLYNAMPLEGAHALRDFMRDFQRKNV